MARLAVWTLLASAWLGGCDANGGSAPSAPADVVPALGELCDLFERCPELPPVASRDRNECIDIVYWLLTCERTDDGVRRVELELDAETASACADALAEVSCDELSCLEDGTCPELEACSPLFGRFDDGGDDGDDVLGEAERCSIGGSPRCGSGLFCAPEHYDAERQVVLCSVCAPLLAAGAACDPQRDDRQCASGLTCIGGEEIGVGTCGPLREDGAECIRHTDCAGGLCADRECSSGGRIGDPCEVRNDCRWEELGADFVACVGGSCAAPLQPGDPCATGDECRSFLCDPSDSRCGVPDEMPCGSDDFRCRSRFCDPNGNVCRPRRADGEPCPHSGACTSGFCDPATSMCAAAPPRRARGEACSSADDCEPGLDCNGVCELPCGPDGSCPEGEVCDDFACEMPRVNGAGCDRDEQCESQFCSSDSEVCMTRPGIGDACGGPTDCYPRGYCRGGVCEARRGPGDRCDGFDSCLEPYLCTGGECVRVSLACEPAPAGEPCTYLRFCDEASYCDFNGFVCAPRLGEGESCIPTLENQCASGLYCPSGGSSAFSCVARAAENEPCDEGIECVEGNYCADGTCRPGAGGQACEESSTCPSGTFCNHDTERCEPLHGEGERCGSFEGDCQPELYCDGGSCRARHPVGETCYRDEECVDSAWCDRSGTGNCEARRAIGEECSWTARDCVAGAYCNDDVVPNVCAMGRPNGERCESHESDECASGHCIGRFCSAAAECVLDP